MSFLTKINNDFQMLSSEYEAMKIAYNKEMGERHTPKKNDSQKELNSTKLELLEVRFYVHIHIPLPYFNIVTFFSFACGYRRTTV